jgi:hypothetical protein
MREAAFRRAAYASYDLISQAEREAIDRAIARLERDPTADGLNTFEIPGTTGLLLYDDGTWQIVYALPDDATLVIRSIAHTLDLPP